MSEALHDVMFREANQLIDIAETGDREAYREQLQSVRERFNRDVAADIARLAKWQHQMYERYTRLFAWRAEWINERRARG